MSSLFVCCHFSDRPDKYSDYTRATTYGAVKADELVISGVIIGRPNDTDES